MSALDDSIKAVLSPLVSGRVYPNTFPQQPLPVWPSIRYTIITVNPAIDLCGAGPRDLANAHVQIDIVDHSYKACRQLKYKVTLALQALATPFVRDAEFNLYDSEVKAHRCTVDYISYPSST